MSRPFYRLQSSGSSKAWFRFLLCCFAAICGVRMFLVARYGVGAAFGDDLDGIARRILLPWQQGTLSWSALFAAHNGDHRIVATRLWEMAWFAINGSWDPKLVMIAKVPVFAAAATIFIHLLAGALERRRFVAGGLLAVLFAFPFAFANLLWAFQSQFDFFFLTAALGWLALVKGRTVIALILAAGAILTLGSGPVVAASFVPFFLMRGLTREWSWRRAGVHVGAALAIVALGVASPTRDAMPHPGTVAEKSAMVARLYGWPFSNLLSIVERLPESERYIPGALLRYPSADNSILLRTADLMHRQPWLPIAFDGLCALLVLAPTALLLSAVIRRRVPLAAATGLLGLGTFASLMILATAAARAEGVTIAPRYLDHVALAGFVSLAAWFVVLARDSRWRQMFAWWSLALGLGYGATMAITLTQISRQPAAVSLSVLQRYFATQPHDHTAMLEGDAFRRFIVSDDPTQFMSELDTPGLERVLPLAVTAPDATPGMAARIAVAVGRFGWLIALIAAAAGVMVAVRSRRRRVTNEAFATPLSSARVTIS